MDAKRSEEITKKVIFTLPSPTPFIELEKAYDLARRELTEKNRRIWDDSILVESHDDEVRLFYVEDGS